MRLIDADGLPTQVVVINGDHRTVVDKRDIDAAPTVAAGHALSVWVYCIDPATNKRYWRCKECGKVCRRNPHDKRFCSLCGAQMAMEA